MDNIYKLLSESLLDSLPDEHPNIDQLIIKPYLFYYVPKDMAEVIQKEGIKDTGEGIYVYFTRVPEIPKFQEFLDEHYPVKISVSKLIRSSENVRVRGVNFPGYEDKELILKKPQLEKMAEKTDKFFKFFEKATSVDQIPRARIEFEDGVIPSFTFKVLGIPSNVDENLKLVSEVLISRQLIQLAEEASNDLDSVKVTPNSKLPRSVHDLLVKTKKMKELKELLPMAKRLTRILKIAKPEFIAARAIVNGILQSNDSKSELIKLSEQ